MRIKSLALAMGLGLLLTANGFAAEEVGNKLCPISGEKVGEMGDIVKHEYNGKIYNFCCKMCLKDFNKDPEKFSKKAEAEVAASPDAGQ